MNQILYEETENKLYKLRDSFPQVEYLYVHWFDENGYHVIFDLDTKELEGEKLGDGSDFDEAFDSLGGFLKALK